MRKNLTLFAILVFLGFISYYFEEIKGTEKTVTERKIEEFHNLKEYQITSISGPNFEIYKADKKYFFPESKVKVSQKSVQEFLKYLGFLKVKRKLDWGNVSEQEKKYIENGLELKVVVNFGKRSLVYYLGQRLELSTEFYMKRELWNDKVREASDYLLVENDAPRFEPNNQKHVDLSGPYLKFKALMDIDISYFYEKIIFENFSKLEDIDYESIRNRDFTLDIKKVETTPKILAGLDYNKKYMKLYLSQLQSISAVEIIESFNNNDLKNKLAKLKLHYGDKIEVIELFSQYKKEDDYFLLKGELVYRLSLPAARMLLVNYQDFWIRRPFGKGLKNISQLDFSMSQNSEKIDFSVPLEKEFIVESKGRSDIEINQTNMKVLFLLLFGGGEVKGALRVNHVTDYYKSLIGKGNLTLNIYDRKLKIKRYNDEVLVWDLRTDLLFHYLDDKLRSLSFNLKDFLKK